MRKVSVRITSRVWESSPYAESALLVHLALADWCDDEGVCYPSQEKIAAKSRVSARWVRELMKRMVDDGYLEVLSESKRGVSRRYRLTFPGSEFHGSKFPGTERSNDRNSLHNDRNSVTPMTGTPASREPSLEPSEEPSVRTVNKPDDFDAFWSAYPRREAKAAARKAWVKAVTVADPQAIIAGAQRYRDDPNRESEFTAHPATWLNAGRWEDDPLPPRSRPRSAQQARSDDFAATMEWAKAQDARRGLEAVGGISDTGEPFRALSVAPSGNHDDSWLEAR